MFRLLLSCLGEYGPDDRFQILLPDYSHIQNACHFPHQLAPRTFEKYAPGILKNTIDIRQRKTFGAWIVLGRDICFKS